MRQLTAAEMSQTAGGLTYVEYYEPVTVCDLFGCVTYYEPYYTTYAYTYAPDYYWVDGYDVVYYDYDYYYDDAIVVYV